jgi:hypothetical protein
MRSSLKLVSLVLVIAILSLVLATSAMLEKPETNTKFINERGIFYDELPLNLRMISKPEISINNRAPDFLIMSSTRYEELLAAGKLGPVKNVWFAKEAPQGASIKDGSEMWVVIEPLVITVPISINGTLIPRTFDSYGPYSSCLYVYVQVTWSPVDQILGIALEDIDAGEGYGYWFTDGSASAGFSTDWQRRYNILILSYAGNTKILNYNGTITLYIW